MTLMLFLMVNKIISKKMFNVCFVSFFLYRDMGDEVSEFFLGCGVSEFAKAHLHTNSESPKPDLFVVVVVIKTILKMLFDEI